MWFAKWFGRRDEGLDDEPARFPPSERAAPSARAPQATKNPGQTKPTTAKKGFDPYNSGAFERKNAWERTNLR